jgi:hypothetical protein
MKSSHLILTSFMFTKEDARQFCSYVICVFQQHAEAVFDVQDFDELFTLGANTRTSKIFPFERKSGLQKLTYMLDGVDAPALSSHEFTTCTRRKASLARYDHSHRSLLDYAAAVVVAERRQFVRVETVRQLPSKFTFLRGVVLLVLGVRAP